MSDDSRGSLAAYLNAIYSAEVADQLPDSRWRYTIPVLSGWVATSGHQAYCRTLVERAVVAWVARHLARGEPLPTFGGLQPVITDVVAPDVLTPRLRLVPFTATMTGAATYDRTSLTRMLGAHIHPDWPYPEVTFDDDTPDDTANVAVDDSTDEKDQPADDVPPWWYELHIEWTLRRPEIAPWLWMIVHAKDNTLIGEIGTTNPLRPGDTDDNVQMGYSLVPDYQGRGYMTEAAFAYAAWAFTHPELRWIFAMTQAINTRSRRVLEKLGARTFVDGDDDFDGRIGWLNWELLPEAFAIAQAARPQS